MLRGRGGGGGGGASAEADGGEDHAHFDRDVFIKSTGIETDDLREFLALGDILDVDAVPEEEPEPRNKYAKWKATSLLCGPADLDLEDIGATLVPLGYRDTTKTTASTTLTAEEQQRQFFELQQQQKAQRQRQEKEARKGRISSYSESNVDRDEEEEEEEETVDDRYSVSSPNLTPGGQHFIDSLMTGAKKTQSPKSPKNSSTCGGGGGGTDVSDSDDPSTSARRFESGSYNTKSGRVTVKSPQSRPPQQQHQHPTAIVAPLNSAGHGQTAVDQQQTTPKQKLRQTGQGDVNKAFVDSDYDDDSDSVFNDDDDAPPSLQKLDINDGNRPGGNIGGRSNNNNRVSGRSSRNADPSILDSAMPTMSPKSELQHQQQQQQQRLYQSRAAVTLSKNARQKRRQDSATGVVEDDWRKEEEEEERRKDAEFLMQIRHDLTTEFIGEDGITRRDAETQTLSTGRILVTEMFMDAEGM